MACGKPIVLTKTKGLWAPKIFKNLKNCILVRPEVPKEIEDSIKILENNKKLYQSICKESRKTAEKHFSLMEANKSTLEIFKK